MNKSRVWFGLTVFSSMAVLVLGACSTQAETALIQKPIEPTAVVAKVNPVAAPAEEVDSCIECHTDKDQLVANAKPEEKKEDESEGVG